MTQAGSLTELAGKVGVDAAGLAETVSGWNRACAGGADPDFGRGGNPYDRYCGDPAVAPNPNLGPIDEAPYYAVRVLAGTIGTKGGPVTDTDGVVLTPSGHRIGGLYAAGNAAAFWTADGYPAPGAPLAFGMTMGWRAGRHAAGRRVRVMRDRWCPDRRLRQSGRGDPVPQPGGSRRVMTEGGEMAAGERPAPPVMG